MSRFLFVVPPLVGHINPTISVGRELTRAGHDVAWAGLPGAVDGLLPPDASFLAAGDDSDTARFIKLRNEAPLLRGAAALKFLWEDLLLPLGHAMAESVERIARSWRPDVIVADQQALAGAAVARKLGLAWATSATTSAEIARPLMALPRAERWTNQLLADFQQSVGVEPELARSGDLRFSEQLVLVYSTPALVGTDRAYPDHYAFVGPAISNRPELETFPWEWLDPSLPHVLMTMGTINAAAGAQLFAVAMDALAGQPLQAVLVAPEELAGTLPAHGHNILVRERVPQLALLRCVDAVVAHGGHNTVVETLAQGLPMVLAPIRDDQPIVADQVVRAGAGVRVKFGRVLPGELRGAVDAVLSDAAYRDAASRIQASFNAAGGGAAAAARLADLVPD